MSALECPALHRILEMLDSEEDAAENFSELTMGKRAFLEKELPLKTVLKLSFERSDLACLRPGNWLNDQILNSYITLMASQCSENIGYTNSFFLPKLERDGCAEASCWAGIKGRPICHYDKFLVPICCGVHWILGCYDFVEGALMILDSFHGRHGNIAALLNGFLEFQGTAPLNVCYPHVPSQLNGDDCGVFVLRFCWCLFFNEDLNSFSQADIPQMRVQIKRDLLETMK